MDEHKAARKSRGMPLAMGLSLFTILMLLALSPLYVILVRGGVFLIELLATVGAAIGFNVWVMFWLRRRGRSCWLDWLVRLGNLFLMTWGVFWTGGIVYNPFTMGYATYIIIAGVRRGTLGARQGFVLVAFSMAILAFLSPTLLQGEELIWEMTLLGVLLLIAVFSGQANQKRIESQQALRESEAGRAQTLAELERYAAQLAALHEIALDIAAHREMPALLEAVAARGADLLNVAGGGVYLTDPDGESLTLSVFHGPGKVFLGTRLRRGEGMAGHVLASGQPLIVADYERWAGRAGVYDGMRWGSVIEVPLLLAGQVVGVLSCFTASDPPRAFGKADVCLLEGLARQAAIAIENARLFETERRRRQEAETLRDVATALVATLDLSQVLDGILVQLARVVPCNSVCVFLFRQGHLHAVAGRGFANLDQVIGQDYPADDPLFEEMWRTRRPLILADASADPRFAGWGRTEQVRGWMGAPLMMRGDVIGCLTIDGPHVAAYSQVEATLVEAFANQAAIAIENARLYEQVQLYAAELEQRVTERTADLQARVAEVEQLNRTMADLVQDLQQAQHRTAATTQQLQAANVELETFAYSVSHDLRVPLRHIDGFVRLLIQREGARLDPTSHRYLRRVAESSHKMRQLIDVLLAFSRTGRTEMRPRRVELDRLVREAQRQVSFLAEGRCVIWKIDPLPDVQGDPTLLRQVWVNLLANALKFTAPRQEARIEIGVSESPGRQVCEDEVAFFVRDNGVGFDPQYASRLFGVFQRLHREEEFEGTGIGLATVRRIVHRHGGRVWAEGAVDGGATFYFTLKRDRKKE